MCLYIIIYIVYIYNVMCTHTAHGRPDARTHGRTDAHTHFATSTFVHNGGNR